MLEYETVAGSLFRLELLSLAADSVAFSPLRHLHWQNNATAGVLTNREAPGDIFHPLASGGQ